MFSGLDERVIDIIERFGYAGIGLLIALETIFPPLPSELILPLGGFTASRGDLTLWGVMLAATLGSVAGALVLYGVGHWFGRERLYWLVDRYGRYLMLKQSDLDRTFDVFERYSGKAVMFGRLIPVVRSLVSLPAGLTRMPLPAFILYTAIGSAVWNGILVGAGYILGDQWDKVESVVGYLQYAVILAAIAGAGWFLWNRLRGKKDADLRRSSPRAHSTTIEPED
ncbi:MAG TPA: DedA family protein [Thermomicrobiales bacterium]|nr:DedA family protein [Thermomicrobiales bacterium]